MSKTEINKRISTLIHTENHVLTVEDWRFRLQNCLTQYPAKGDAWAVLTREDEFYTTKDGVFEWSNVRNNRGGLMATARAVLILERVLKGKKAKKTYLRKIKTA